MQPAWRGESVLLPSSLRKPGGEVEKVTLVDATINGKSSVGSIAGRNDGTLQYCALIGTSNIRNNAGSNYGGLVGHNSGIVEKSYVALSAGSISGTGTTSSSYAGGIVGNNDGGIVENCHYSGSGAIGPTNTIGGIVGRNSNNGIVCYCYYAGNRIGGGASQIGAIIGRNYPTATVEYCYYNNATVKQAIGNNANDPGTVRGLTATQFQNIEIFSGFSTDFWLQGVVAPLLKGMKYTISFNANGGTGSMANQTVSSLDDDILSTNTFTRANYNVSGWNTKADGTGVAIATNTEARLVGPEILYAQWTDKTLILVDGTTYDKTIDEIVAAVTYTKTLDEGRVGLYQPWLVPFDYTIKEADTQKFTFYKIHMIANAPNPQTNVSDQMWVFLKQTGEGDVLHANKPYVYKAKEAVTDYPFTTQNTVLKAKETGVTAKTETMEDIYNFYATYDATTATALDPFYYVNTEGTISLGNNGTISVAPFRWIIRKVSKYGNTPSYAPNMIFFDGDETTGINSLTPDPSPTGEGSDYWYDLSGRKLEKQPMQKGLYIVNGNKVVIK